MSTHPAKITQFSEENVITYSELISRSEFDDVNERIASSYDLRHELKNFGGRLRKNGTKENGTDNLEWVFSATGNHGALINRIKQVTKSQAERSKRVWSEACAANGVKFVSRNDVKYDAVKETFKELICERQ